MKKNKFCLPVGLAILMCSTSVFAQTTGTVTINAANLEGEIGPFWGKALSHEPKLFEGEQNFLGPLDRQRVLDLDLALSRSWVRVTPTYNYTTQTFNFDEINTYLDAVMDTLPSSGRMILNFGIASYDNLEFDDENNQVTITPNPGTPSAGGTFVLSYSQMAAVIEEALLHYKSRYGDKLEYIEVGNEPGSSTGEGKVYGQYKLICRAVAAINNTNPGVELKVGGPVPASFRQSQINTFLDQYIADPDTTNTKRLDFISWHEYRFRDDTGDPDMDGVYISQVEQNRANLENWLSSKGLPTDTLGLITETGVFAGGQIGHTTDGSNTNNATIKLDREAQAAAMMTMHYHYLNSQPEFSNNDGYNIPLHWTTQHTVNPRKDMFVRGLANDGEVLPFYNAVVMQGMMEDERITTVATPQSNGFGLYALGSRSDTRLTALVWNNQFTRTSTSIPALSEYDVNLTISNLPSAFQGSSYRYDYYLIDSQTSNYDYDPNTSELQLIETGIRSAATGFSDTLPTLGKNAVALVVLTADSGSNNIVIEAEDLTRNPQFELATVVAASGGQAIKAVSSTTFGTASFSFNGPTGEYEVGTYYFDENDGNGSIRLRINGDVVDAWTANQDLGSDAPNAQTLVIRQTGLILIEEGQTVSIEALQDGNEFTRIDKLTFAGSSRIEAESLPHNAFFDEVTIAAASNGAGLKATSTSTFGTADYIFTGNAGTYNVRTAYFDENDGVGQIQLFKNFTMIDSWTLNENSGYDYAAPEALRIRETAGVSLDPNDVLQIRARAGGTEFTRIDYLELEPASRIEAETLSINAYFEVSSIAAASNGAGLKSISTSNFGEAALAYSGSSGTFDVNVAYFDENDGVGQIQVLKNGNLIDNWLLNENTGFDYADAQALRIRSINGIALQNGDVITLRAKAGGTEFTRIDYIEIQ